MNSLRVTLFSATAALLVAINAPAQSNLVLLLSPAGDYIGQGGTYYTTNESEFGISGRARHDYGDSLWFQYLF